MRRGNWPIVDESYMRSVTHYNQGNEWYALGRRDEALQQFREAVRLYPGNAQAIHNLARALSEQGDRGQSIEHYEAALRIDPTGAEVRDELQDVREGAQ